MSYNNGIITAPDGIYDVQKVLGNSSPELRTLCRDENINMWAKFKPVDLAQIATTDEWDAANNKWKETASWFQGKTGVCGITPYSTTSFANIISNTNNDNNGWVYNKPSGGTTSPYRLMDFAGYNHRALPAASNFVGSDNLTAGGRFSAGCAVPAVAGGDNVTLADFSQYRLMYFGAAIVNSNNTVVYWGTAGVVGSYDVGFNLPAGFATGTYKVYPFLCADAITPGTPDQTTHTFWTLPNCTYFTLTVGTTPQPIENFHTTGRWTNTQHTAVEITVQNNTSINYNGGIYIRRGRRQWTDTPYTDEKQTKNVTFVAGATQTYNFTGLSSNYLYHAQLVLDNGNVAEILIMDDSMPEE